MVLGLKEYLQVVVKSHLYNFTGHLLLAEKNNEYRTYVLFKLVFIGRKNNLL